MLEFADVSVRYQRIHALRKVSLTVPKGGIFTVLGANGAGKTTLLRCAMGLVGADSAVSLAGIALAGMPAFKRAALGMALVHEGRRLFPEFTVGENLMIGAYLRRDKARVEEDLNQVFSVFPKLRQRYAQPAKTLSGGEGQMLAIGRALMMRPKLLLLDEPSVGIMPKAVSEIFELISRIPRERDMTVLLVEQNARKAIAIADRFAVLELGSIVMQGAAAEAANDPKVKKAYLGG